MKIAKTLAGLPLLLIGVAQAAMPAAPESMSTPFTPLPTGAEPAALVPM